MRRHNSRFLVCALVLLTLLLLTVPLVGCGGEGDGNGNGNGDGNGSSNGNKVSWITSEVSLKCDNFYIVANGQTFYADVDRIDVHGWGQENSGCGLELTWQENGVEMRFNLEFKNDGREWWSYDTRTYNGQVDAEWIYYTGDLFETTLGEAFGGTLELHSGSDKIHFDNLNLQAFVNWPY